MDTAANIPALTCFCMAIVSFWLWCRLTIAENENSKKTSRKKIQRHHSGNDETLPMGQTRTDGPGQVYRVDSRRQLKRLPRLDRIQQFSFPLLWSLAASVSPQASTAQVNGFGLGNYTTLFKYGAELVQFLLNSAYVALLTVAITLMVRGARELLNRHLAPV